MASRVDGSSSPLIAPPATSDEAAASSSVARFVLSARERFEGITRSELSMQEQHTQLRKLRKSIREVRRQDPDGAGSAELAALHKKVNRAIRTLQQAFETRSHWLARTVQHGRHMETMQPALGKTPIVKLSLNDVEGTLKSIEGLKRGLDQLRALQKFHQMVSSELAKVEEALLQVESLEEAGPASASSSDEDEGASLRNVDDELPPLPKSGGMEFAAGEGADTLQAKRAHLQNALRLIADFGDRNLDFKQKLLLVLRIEVWDADPMQTLELKTLVDKFGGNFAAFFLTKTGISVEQLFDSLLLLMQEVHERHPDMLPSEIVQKWPQIPEALEGKGEISGFTVAGLQKLAEIPGFLDDPSARVVHDYLLSFIDPDGLLRLNQYHAQASRKEISTGKFYRLVGELAALLQMYGRPVHQIFARIEPAKQKTRQATPFASVAAAFRSGIGGKSRGVELRQLARTIRAQVSALYIEMVTHSKGIEPARVDALGTQIAGLEKRFRAFFQDLVAYSGTHKEKVAMIGNCMNLASLLAAQGNFYFSITLMSALERVRYRSPECKAAWDRYVELKSSSTYRALDALFSTDKNFRNYRAAMEENEAKGALCLPLISVLKGELDKHKRALNQNKATTVKVLVEVLSTDELAALCNRLYLDSKDSPEAADNNWRTDHLLDNLQQLLCVLDKIELHPDKRAACKKAVERYRMAKVGPEMGSVFYDRNMYALAFALMFEQTNRPPINLSNDFLALVASQSLPVAADE